MRDAERLDQMRGEADRRDKTARLREQDRDRLAGDVQRREQQARTTALRARQRLRSSSTVRGARPKTARTRRGAATRTGRQSRNGGGPCRRADRGGEQEPDLARARRATVEIAERQGQAVARMAELLGEAARRRQALIRAQEETDRLTAEIQAATGQVESAEHAAADRAAELADAYRGWLGGLVELHVPEPNVVIESLIAWAMTGDGPNPAAGMVDDAARAAGAELGRQEERLSAHRLGHMRRADDLETEIGRLLAGGHDIPPVPHTREPAVRDGRPGAPLWKVTDFAPGLDESERAGLEAALEASGILDAWVTPEGDLVLGGRRPGQRGRADRRAVAGRHPRARGQRRRPDGLDGHRQFGPCCDVCYRGWRGRCRMGRYGRTLGERRAGRGVVEGRRGIHRRGRA